MKKIFFTIAMALALTGCASSCTQKTNPERTKKLVTACESWLDTSLNAAVNARAEEIEAEYNKLYNFVRDNNGRLPNKFMDIRFAKKFGEIDGKSIFFNPAKGEMTLAAQKGWAKGEHVDPIRPHVAVKEIPANVGFFYFGWKVEPTLHEDGALECQYTADYSLNPYSGVMSSLTRGVFRIMNGQNDLTVGIVVEEDGKVRETYRVGNTPALDSDLLEFLTMRQFQSDYFSKEISMVVGADYIRKMKAASVQQHAELKARSGSPVAHFWFEDIKP